MIFFMTIIVPSSNLSAELNQIQKQIFSDFKYIPTPFPLLITALNTQKPNRPTRKEISLRFPEDLTMNGFSISGNNLILKVKEIISFSFDSELPFKNFNNENGFILSGCLTKNLKTIDSFTCPEIESISNYSLACYKIECENTEAFWLNMNWNKLWEVKKGKKKF